MKNFIDSKTEKPRYKVNGLDKNKKEVWQYCYTIKRARALQQSAETNGLPSIIFQKVNGKYVAI